MISVQKQGPGNRTISNRSQYLLSCMTGQTYPEYFGYLVVNPGQGVLAKDKVEYNTFLEQGKKLAGIMESILGNITNYIFFKNGQGSIGSIQGPIRFEVGFPELQESFRRGRLHVHCLIIITHSSKDLSLNFVKMAADATAGFGSRITILQRIIKGQISESLYDYLYKIRKNKLPGQGIQKRRNKIQDKRNKIFDSIIAEQKK